ncbi:MAG: UvrD-helicase domain-containing protein [Clostridia bacterium]|nr:UvrD-helicase domain-containing protein [Clostridia bacterium]
MPKLKTEQTHAIDHQDGNLLVSASAGSGKTFVMIERLIRLIKENHASVSQILAVTFTESAALDMKEKLKKALKKSIAEEGNTHLASAVAEVQTADISTIHAFCAKLIRKYFFAVDVAPDFVIADENVASLIKNQSIDKVFKKYYGQKDQEFLSLVDKFSSNRGDDGLKELILKLFDFFSAEANPIEKARETLANYTEQGTEKLLQEYLGYFKLKLSRLKIQAESALSGVRRFSLVAGEKFCNDVLDDIALYENMSIEQILESPAYERKLVFDRKLPPEAVEYKELIAGVRDSLKKIIPTFKKYLLEGAMDKREIDVLYNDGQKICELIEAFTKVYSDEKTEENLLDFSDLEHFALKVLQDETVRKSVSEKYKYIFIDEYQDVNGVQESIIGKIANDNLFMVGDVKQSIYGFRGCRADFFSNKLEEMPKKGEKTLLLNYNFRSADAVIQTVNKIFCYSMTQDRFGMDYTKCMLVAGGLYGEQYKGRAQLHVLTHAKKERSQGEQPRVYDILQELGKVKPQGLQDADMACLVAEIINKEIGKPYYDIKEEREKSVRMGDIAILTRNRETAYVQKLVNGLISHGIPVVSEVAQDICQTQEIQILINLLKLINSYSGDIPLASTLKSAVGKFTEEQLAEIVLFYQDNYKPELGKSLGGFYDAFIFYMQNANTHLSVRLKEFDAYFKKIRQLSDFKGAHDILQKVILDCGFMAEIYADSHGELKAKRVRKFLSESIRNGKKLSVSEFLSLIKNDKKTFTMSEIAEEDTVKIMTMHASKGLEFPVVIVCGLERNMRMEEDKNVCFTDRKWGFATKYYDTQTRSTKETLLRAVIKERQREEDVKEELRLFYVATTRATYSLHLMVDGDLGTNPENFVDTKSFKECIPNTIEQTVHDQSEFAISKLEKQKRAVLFGSPSEDATKRIKNNLAYSYPFSEDSLIPLKSSVTKELSLLQEQTALQHYIFEDEDTTDIERGVIAHKLLENLDFSFNLNLQKECEKLMEKGVLDKQSLDKISISKIQKVFDSGVFDRVVGKKLYREKTFIAGVEASLIKECNSNEKVLIQGAVDLIAVGDDGADIIDYKYSSLVPQSLKDKYSKQLQVYARAFTVATGIKVKSTCLINLFTGDVVDV